MRFCPRIRSLHRQRIYCADPARAVYYGQRGRISAREVYDPVNACSCLTLILACIVYWPGQGDLTHCRRSGLPVRPRPAASCQPDRVEQRHPLRRDQDRPRQAQAARALACISARIGSVPDLAAMGGARRGFRSHGRAQKTVILRGRGLQGSGYRYRYIPDRQPLHLAFHSAHRHRF